MTDNLHHRIARSSNLDCKVARRFSDRPVLLDAADQILRQQWLRHLPDNPHDPLALYLASRHPRTGDTWVRPLSHVLVERYCARKTLNLSDGENFVTTHVDGDPAWQVDIDLHRVELLINEAGPFLLEAYEQSLTAYWSAFDRNGQTPWQWYAAFLRAQLQTAVDAHRSAGSLPGFALAVATLVHDQPFAQRLDRWSNTAGLKVSHLGVDFSADGKLDTDLASALLIEHADGDPTRDLTLLFTLAGKLYSFKSRQDMLEAIGRYWPAAPHYAPRQVSISLSSQGHFETQALGVLDQQLRVITHRAGQYRTRLDALNMNLDLDRLTSMIALCSEVEATKRQSLLQHLPDWLRNAQSRSLMHFSTLLLDVAQGCQDNQGQFWLDDVDNAQGFANRQLAARFAADHPDDSVDPKHVRVFNYQTTGVAAPAQGGVLTTGEVTPVEYTLAQLAIGNLGLLRPGRVELRSTDASPLPEWMTESYLRSVVSELDIGASYPAMLRRKLLDDPNGRVTRQRLLTTQLRSQLPALAQELYLRGKLPDQQAASGIAQVFWTAEDDEARRWIMRPLGFIKSPGASVDHPCNTWLIEPLSAGAETCLLYRPLHEDTLLQFSDRLALFVAISSPGKLQDDLLQRLAPENRRFYANGGFLEPHLFVILEDTSALPWGTPAPVELARETPVADPGAALYLACVNESLQHFEEHAATTAQTRWTRWKELGWLLFNTLLPLAGGTLGKVAWLAQMEVALAEYVDADAEREPSRYRLSIVNLLVNISMLLFAHSLVRLRQEQGETAPFSAIAAHLTEPESFVPEPPKVRQPADSRLDFAWTRPTQTLTNAQRDSLNALQATVATSSLGTPVPSGALRGLYLHDSKLYTQLGGKVYEVELGMPRNQMRIVGPDHEHGPWLRRDEVGRWQLDLRLVLEGGMPLPERIRRMQLDKESALRTVNEQIKADKDAISEKIKQQTTIEKIAAATQDDTTLQTCQEKLQALSNFWTTHIERLKIRNGLEPLKDFKKVHAFAVYQDSFCQRLQRKILHMRYQPAREQLLQLARQQQQGMDLSASDARIAASRLDTLAPLIEQMIDNNTRLRQNQDTLNKLASPQQPEILQWSKLAAAMPATAERDLILRFLRLEALVNRMTLVHGLSGDAPFWRDRFWSNVELGIAQRAKLFRLVDADEEVAVRLLRSILEQFQAAARQLGHFAEQISGEAGQRTMRQLQEQVDWILSRIKQELAELPDYPSISTLQQLRKKVPGLIDTTEHGLLLAEPRADDANTVDIPGPDNKTNTRTYHLKQGEWVELQPAQAATQRAGQSLKRLLNGSDRLMKSARDEVARLQAVSSRYLPVELEESVRHQQERLQAHADAIEARLTEDNETDEALGDKDAEQVARALRGLADELQGQATQLRVAAAMAQKPRMGEVMFLVEGKHVQISRVGSRTRLASVKGRPADFLDEYGISHDGQVLWYAHFHYPTMNTAKADFTAGHLKLAAQRHMPGHRYADGSGTVVEVYRAQITASAAARYFFNL
ncbi:hypothetical protein [Pseudomonas sp. CCOS 191]|uniref:hypothetical protein n=1 Tax=Pseudomonas sp. CCOS 191 TaxID=1649877 RepID=UPI0018E6A447|nr:hypothetical protein [Pseudomonas sp. CCOS 191]MBI6955295.1 hypothetical protein [Pseudomonas sp. CCOS 191]